MKKLIMFIGLSLLLSAQLANAAAFTEPNMADYTAFPINTTQSVPPNIMIILDNSGSMNFNAYGTYPGDSGTVSDAPFTGEPYSGIKSFQMTSGQDDAEEGVAGGSVLYHNHSDLDLGGFSVASNDCIVGIRIQNVAIPQGATIHSAYLEFNANASNAETSNFLIEGDYSDDAAPFDTVADNLKSRTGTTATVAWDNVQAWTAGQYYPTPDISTIVQQIVDRGGWNSGNSMVFRFTGAGTTDNKRDIRAYDASSGTAPTLHVVFSDASVNTRYYGYFNPDYFYNYNNQKFNLAYKKVAYNHTSSSWSVETLTGASDTLTDADIVNNKLWDGNWLNWLSMRRVDVLRKVLMGGLATARTGGGNQVNYGETPAQSYRVFIKRFDSSIASAVSPYDGDAQYCMENGRIYVDADLNSSYETNFNIRIQKDSNHEPEDFLDGNLAGVLQRIGDEKARWGNIWFNEGSGSNRSGGTVEHTIGTNLTSLVTDLQNTGMDTWTPLAEAFYVAMQYFKQENPKNGLNYPNNAVANDNLGDDPYYNGKEHVPCAKSFVLLLTDGASSKDAMIPDTYWDFDGDGKEVSCDEDNCNYPNGGSDYLDDLAFYARTKDLRADLDGDQNLFLYAIHAFDKDPNATNLLRDAARNGGFDDRNKNGLPDGDYTSPADQRLEWDKDGDGVPDTFFEANDGYELEARLLEAITDMLERASSGTTASVLATNNLGAGNSVQSYYRPLVTEGLEEAKWLGYMQSLWIDPWGNLREDSNNNKQLDLRSAGKTNTADSDVDRIVQMVNIGEDTVLRRYHTHYLYNSSNGGSGQCEIADCSVGFTNESLNDVQALFEAGDVLSKTDPDHRTIFTYLGDTGVVASSDDMFDNGGDVVLFDTGLDEKIKPFLGVRNDTVWGDSGAGLGVDHDTRVTNIIKWIRGTDIPGLRNRTLDKVTWRLGDIVHSTPMVVGPAKQYFHLIYDQKDYFDYINYRKTRETVVYVGANDGMLHAFTNYVLTKDNDTQSLKYEQLEDTKEAIGTELWAYIPQSVLPHLKWTASTDYTHTYYVNSQPRVFDAKVLPDDMHYADDNPNPNYGTFMVFGLNMGGKDISVNEDFGSGTNTVRDFSPTYVLMDITDPRKPRVLWERSYSGLGMSVSTPAPVHIGDLDSDNGQWFLVFGSGATDYDHSPDNLDKGRIFVVDMLTGEPYGTSATEDWIWESSRDSYFNAPMAMDYFLSNNVDAIYLAENYYNNSGSEWQADILKIAIPCTKCPWSEDMDGNVQYSRDEYAYNNDPFAWSVSTLFEADGPVTAKLNCSSDHVDPLQANWMLFFGTGRYINNDDKTDTNQQYFYCVKDPFYNSKYAGSYYRDFGNVLTLSPSKLMNSDNIVVTSEGNVSGYSGYTDFNKFREHVRAEEDGWYLSLLDNSPDPAERIISQVAIYGGLFLTPTFSPSTDVCSMGGVTTFMAGYYETGTGYIKPVFSELPDGAAETNISIRSSKYYVGMPPSQLVLHVGQEKGTMVTVQLGTGELLQFTGFTATSNDNAMMEYTDDPTQAPAQNPACDWGNDDTNLVTDFPTGGSGGGASGPIAP